MQATNLQALVQYAEWMAARHAQESFNQCLLWTQEMQQAFPELRRVRGWVDVPGVGERPHWWLVTADGVIVDPTARQFWDKPDEDLKPGVPCVAYYGGAGITAYREVDESNPPIGRCMNCGRICYRATAPSTMMCSVGCEEAMVEFMKGGR